MGRPPPSTLRWRGDTSVVIIGISSKKLKAGLHTGECELIGDDIAGVAVHIGAALALEHQTRRAAFLRPLGAIGETIGETRRAHQ
jgi:hypothetical protein